MSGDNLVICTAGDFNGGRFFSIPWEAFAAEKVKAAEELALEGLEKSCIWDAEKGTRQSWTDAKQRATNRQKYPDYGHVEMHPDWILSYEVFRDYCLRTIGLRPAKNTSLHRIGDGHYAPGCVKWADASEQSRERRPFRSYPRIYAEADGSVTI